MNAPSFAELTEWGYAIFGLPCYQESLPVDEPKRTEGYCMGVSFCDCLARIAITADKIQDCVVAFEIIAFKDVFLRADGVRVVEIDGIWFINEGLTEKSYRSFDHEMQIGEFKLRKIEREDKEVRK